MHRVFMSGVILSSLLLLAAGNRAAAEEPLAVDSRISSATIYSSQARVERALAVPPGKGVVRLQVGPLPATLLDDSVRVEGDPHLRVLSVEVSRASGADRASPEFLRLEADRRAREEELADLQRRAGAALERMRRFRDLEVGSPPRSATEPSVPPISTESWGSYLELARRGMEDAWQAARAHESRVRELGKEMAVIRKRMAELEVPSRRRSAAALIQVQNMTGEGGTLRLSYGIPLAFWYPEYSVEIDPVSGTAELSLFGVVHQRTGEDWPEIPIHFSTSIPESGAGLGELTSVRIERRRFAEATDEDLGLALGLDAAPKRARGRPAARKSVPRAPPPEDTAASHRDLSAQAYAGTLSEYGDEAWSEESRRRRKQRPLFIDVPEKLVLPVEAARGFITTFRSLRPEAVPSDGAPHRLFLKRLSLPFREERTLAAELSEHIFRRIRAPVTGEDPVIEGRAAVFLGGAYLGLARIPTTAPTGELRIDLGVDDRLRVRRRQGDREEEVGVFSKNQRFITEVTIEIENFHGEAMEVEVRERIPFTEEESIRVSLIGKRTAPPPDDHREHAGLLTWRIRVPPGGKSDIRYRYHIDTPRGFQLVRREDPSRLEEGE